MVWYNVTIRSIKSILHLWVNQECFTYFILFQWNRQWLIVIVMTSSRPVQRWMRFNLLISHSDMLDILYLLHLIAFRVFNFKIYFIVILLPIPLNLFFIHGNWWYKWIFLYQWYPWILSYPWVFLCQWWIKTLVCRKGELVIISPLVVHILNSLIFVTFHGKFVHIVNVILLTHSWLSL